MYFLFWALFGFGNGYELVDWVTGIVQRIEVATHVCNCHDNIDRIRVEYKSFTLDENGTHDNESFVYRDLYFCRPGTLCLINAHGDADFSWQEDIKHCKTVVNDRTLVGFWQLNRIMYTLQLKDELPDGVCFDVLYLATGWWPIDNYKPPRFRGVSSSIIAVLFDFRYRFWVESDSIVCFEWPGHDSIQLNRNYNFAICKRSIFANSEMLPMQEIESFGFVHVTDGLWRPTSIVSTMKRVNGIGINSKSELKISDVEVNGAIVDISSELADMAMDGTVEVGDDERFIQEYGDGHIHLAKVRSWIGRHFEVQSVVHSKFELAGYVVLVLLLASWGTFEAFSRTNRNA